MVHMVFGRKKGDAKEGYGIAHRYRRGFVFVADLALRVFCNYTQSPLIFQFRNVCVCVLVAVALKPFAIDTMCACPL